MGAAAKILVTGATGFVGSNLVRLLLDQGAHVVASHMSNSKKNLEGIAGELIFHQADIGAFTDILRMVQLHAPEIIYHIAAMRGPQCDANPESGIRSNVLGTYHILEASRLFGVKQIIFTSSLSIFSAAHPTDAVLHDYTTTRPETVYGAAKLFSENLGLYYRRMHGIDFRGLRLATVLGPGTKAGGYLGYLNKSIEESVRGNPYAIYVAPHSRVPIIDVRDAARACVELAAAPADKLKTINYNVLGTPNTPSAQDLVDAVKTAIPSAALSFDINPEFQRMLDANIVKPFDDSCARAEWGWKGKFGLSETVASFFNTNERRLAPDRRLTGLPDASNGNS